MELICTACKRNNHLTGNKFCYKCGSTLIELTSRCCSCGYELQSIDEFCPECGKGVVPATQNYRICLIHDAAVVRFTSPACPLCTLASNGGDWEERRLRDIVSLAIAVKHGTEKAAEVFLTPNAHYDDEQPVSISIPLGEYRRAVRLLHELEKAQ